MEYRDETTQIQGFVDRENFHAAINTAISAMNACRRKGDQAGVDYFLSVMQGIIATMTDTYGSGGAEI